MDSFKRRRIPRKQGRELRETGGRRSGRVEGAQRTNKRSSKWGGRGSNGGKRSP